MEFQSSLSLASLALAVTKYEQPTRTGGRVATRGRPFGNAMICDDR
jgi:hypothetical protein